jgi:hypothetical protein
VGVSVLTLLVTLVAIIAGGAFWAGKIDSRIDAQDGRMQTLFEEQDRRLEIQFKGLDQSIDALDQNIDDLDQGIDARIAPYDYHHHVEDGAVVFSLSPEGR